MIKFAIITPTMQRESLLTTCESVNTQTHVAWEHVVQVDSDFLDTALLSKISHPQRRVYSCGKYHKSGGNICRRLALEKAEGDYCYFVDDDNFLAHVDALKEIAEALESADRPAWGLFPILRLGDRFYTDPPRPCHVDTLNFVLRKDIAFWPDTDAYGTDGILVEDLLGRKIPYVAFPHVRPVAVIPKISFCE